MWVPVFCQLVVAACEIPNNCPKDPFLGVTPIRQITGLGFGMWSAISNFIDKVHTLGVFAKVCHQIFAYCRTNA